MTKKKAHHKPSAKPRASKSLDALRQKREKLDTSALSVSEIRELIHDLEVYQEELETQNEELRQIQNELGKTKNQYFDLYEFAPVGYLTTNGQGVIDQANLAVATLCGQDRENLGGLRLEKLVASECRDACYLLLREADGEGEAQEMRLERPDGETLWVAAQATRQQTAPGETDQLRVVFTDITERKLMEMELAEAKDEAERANRCKSEFLAHMSHDIRTPMNGVVGFTDLLLRKPEIQGELRRCLEIIDSSAETLLRLIDDLLELSRIETGKLNLVPKEVDLKALVGDVLNTAFPLIDSDRVKVQQVFSGEVPRLIEIDPVRLKQILTNLIGNAVKWTERGEISVCVELAGNSAFHRQQSKDNSCELLFSVRDSGPGIPPEEWKRIFDAHERGDAPNVCGRQGAGLGLTIAKRLAQLLGGEIWVESELDKGATFFFTVIAGVSDRKRKELSKPSPAVENSTGQRPMRLLAVDDEPHNLALLEMVFESRGHDFVTVATGEEAVELCAREKFDAVLLDLGLPDISGYEVAARLRADEAETGWRARVIALTGYAMEEDRQQCFDADMDDYLSKPLRIDRLDEALANCLR